MILWIAQRRPGVIRKIIEIHKTVVPKIAFAPTTCQRERGQYLKIWLKLMSVGTAGTQAAIIKLKFCINRFIKPITNKTWANACIGADSEIGIRMLFTEIKKQSRFDRKTIL